uniref:Uncharacterized protein n=1 Tax=Anguilla anguilla TaxID=7936 RepID=A0A0E9PCA9_ANGAN
MSCERNKTKNNIKKLISNHHLCSISHLSRISLLEANSSFLLTAKPSDHITQPI